jgi:hypothetical protein
MSKLARLLGLRRDRKQWENPRSSIGERRGVLQNGKYICWEAVRPVREAWITLRHEIMDYVQNSCKYGPALSLGIYMIGRTEDTATPKILICSTDLKARKEVRRAIMESGIMNNYPVIGLGDSAGFPIDLAPGDIKLTFPPNSNLGDEAMVLSSPVGNAFGRRLSIPRRDGSSFPPTTAGPIFHNDDKVYQLTVGHDVLERDDVALFETHSSSLDDCDFDGQSDSEDDDSSASKEKLLLTNETIPQGDDAFVAVHSKQKDAQIAAFDTSQYILDRSEDEDATLSHDQRISERLEPQSRQRRFSNLSDISRTSSLASIADSIFSLASGSSMSSIISTQGASDCLISVLREDTILQLLYQEALTKVAADRFERNLRRLLKQFAIDLLKEAENSQQRGAANFVRSRVRSSANIICSSLNRSGFKPVPKTLVTVEIPQEAAGDALDGSSESGDQEDDPTDLQQLEVFIINSRAFEKLRQNLRLLIYPE